MEEKKTNSQTEKHEELQDRDNFKLNKLIDPKTLKIDQLETIKNEIKKNKKSNSTTNKKKIKYAEILKNTVIFILIQVYFIIVMLGSYMMSTITYITSLKAIILLVAVIAVVIFEIAFKRDSTMLAFHGIEVMGIGIATVVILDLYNRQSNILSSALVGAISIFMIYYVIKILYISLKKKTK